MSDNYDYDPFSDMQSERSFATSNSTMANDEFLFTEHMELPVDSYSLNWLRHKPLSRSEKEHLNEWESSLPR